MNNPKKPDRLRVSGKRGSGLDPAVVVVAVEGVSSGVLGMRLAADTLVLVVVGTRVSIGTTWK